MWTDENNIELKLGRQIGNRGGEGCVYEILGHPESVAKVYHTLPDVEKISKLRAQIALADEELRRLATWPISLLKRDGHLAGFTMPRAHGKAIHLLYRPIDRRDHFPGTTWQNLVAVAQNIAAAFHGLHSRKILMGDVNESNILITPHGEVRIIDCDSFQICHMGRAFPCEVHVPFWTPPELQGRSFGRLIRTDQHDAFGLAVLIFHVLFMGRHPFAGVPKARHLLENPPPLEECIRSLQFAHTRRTAIQFSPPPYSLPLSSLPESVADLFERAFLTDKRPSASDWHRELGTLRFQKCQWEHTFSRHQNECPWCVIWNSGGPNFFVSLASVDRGGTSVADIERLLREVIGACEPLPDDASIQLMAISAVAYTVPAIETLKADIPPPRPFPASVKPYRVEFSIGWGMIIVAVGLAFAAPSAAIIWLILGVVGFNYVSEGYTNPKFKEEIECRSQGVAVAHHEIEKLLLTMKAADAKAHQAFRKQQDTLVSDIRQRQTQLSGKFTAERGALRERIEKLLARYQSLPGQRDWMRREISEKSQLEEFLAKFRVSGHRIHQIGPARSALLAQFGIVTAWDVERMTNIAGLGQGVVELRLWVGRLKKRSRFDPSRRLTDASEQEIRRDIQKLEKEILDELDRVKKEWSVLKLHYAAPRLQQLRAVEITGYRRKLDSLNDDTTISRKKHEIELQRLIAAFGQAKADADALSVRRIL